MKYTELNAWVNDQVNVQKHKVVVLSLNNENVAQEDMILKKLSEFAVNNGSEIISLNEIIDDITEELTE